MTNSTSDNGPEADFSLTLLVHMEWKGDTDMLNRLAVWLWSLNPKNMTWLAEQMPPNKATEEDVARIDAEIKALLAKRPVDNA